MSIYDFPKCDVGAIWVLGYSSIKRRRLREGKTINKSSKSASGRKSIRSESLPLENPKLSLGACLTWWKTDCHWCSGPCSPSREYRAYRARRKSSRRATAVHKDFALLRLSQVPLSKVSQSSNRKLVCFPFRPRRLRAERFSLGTERKKRRINHKNNS